MPAMMTLHFKDGTTAEMDSIDARRVLRDHPSEWSAAPFPADYVKTQAEKVRAEQAEKDAQRKAAEEKARQEADEKATREQAERDLEALRIAEEQEVKRKADEAARAGNLSVDTVPLPITNDGLKVGLVPSEVSTAEAPTAPFVARDKGRGWWAIFDSKGVQVGGSIREEEAESFNALSEEDKAEYVKAETAKS